MTQGPKIFQIVIMVVFVAFLLLGFLGFSGKLPLPGGDKKINYGVVTMWGNLPAIPMQGLITAITSADKSITIKYVEKNPASLRRDFVEALAVGQGPDIIMLSQDEILKNINKLSFISYESIPERDFKSTFIEEGEMFLWPSGISALPFTIDPIIMYWNRDIFTDALETAPPKTWSEFYNLVPKITIRDGKNNITRSLVSFGEYRNVTNAKEIIATLLLQAGVPIVQNTNGAIKAGIFVEAPSNTENPAVTTMRFFTEFSKDYKDSYSWNRSLSPSRIMFERGDLAIYFGFSSEYSSIKLKNPHLNFDVSLIPQISPVSKKITFGRMYGLAIADRSENKTGALYAVSLLSQKDSIDGFGSITGLPPVRRDLVSIKQTDAVASVFYNAALIARAWQDPSPEDTSNIFMTMIDSITSERVKPSSAVLTAQSSLARLLEQYQPQ
ncbi:MAG: extracellular solute-binding protein [bacterium]|nr:extracellular solute-binding protein [bacterium]